MTPLLDGDILLYECGFAAQYADEDTGEKHPKAFEDAQEMLEQRIYEICEEVWATEWPILFFTGDRDWLRLENKKRKRNGEKLIKFKPNFRIEAAVTTPYKNRDSHKPYHYKNLKAFCHEKYKCNIAWGMEADDMLGVWQTRRLHKLDTIICSRDKDLRQVAGWHYGWECGKQDSFGPHLVEGIGHLDPPDKRGLKGTGDMFFFAQMIMGDTVDTIPGLQGCGPSKAYKLLKDCTTEEELYEKVSELYKERMGETWFDYFTEQASLLWMVRELNAEGGPVPYLPPIFREVPQV